MAGTVLIDGTVQDFNVAFCPHTEMQSLINCGREVLFETCVAMKLMDDDDDDG